MIRACLIMINPVSALHDKPAWLIDLSLQLMQSICKMNTSRDERYENPEASYPAGKINVKTGSIENEH